MLVVPRSGDLKFLSRASPRLIIEARLEDARGLLAVALFNSQAFPMLGKVARRGVPENDLSIKAFLGRGATDFKVKSLSPDNDGQKSRVATRRKGVTIYYINLVASFALLRVILSLTHPYGVKG